MEFPQDRIYEKCRRFDNYVDYLIKQGIYRELINYLLIWDKTSEGVEFWDNIDTEWRIISDRYINKIF